MPRSLKEFFCVRNYFRWSIIKININISVVLSLDVFIVVLTIVPLVCVMKQHNVKKRANKDFPKDQLRS